MGYYRGDYYRGDYYRGDNFFSKLGKTIGNVGQILTNPIGYAEQHLFGSGGPPKPPTGFMPGAGSQTGVVPLIKRTKQFLTGGGGTETEKPVYGSSGYFPGYHWNGKKWVRNRHMNPLNVKALRRADRRARSFLRITKSVVKHYVPKQPKGRSYIHTRRRKRS